MGTLLYDLQIILSLVRLGRIVLCKHLEVQSFLDINGEKMTQERTLK